MIDDFRREFGERQQRGSALVTGMVWTFAALAVGALIFVGWNRLPLPRITAMMGSGGEVKTAATAPAFASTGKRVGRASTAPVLRVCMSAAGNLGEGAERMEPSNFYQILQTMGAASRVSQVLGRTEAVDDDAIAMMWGELADCVFAQTGRAFCDIDNRALAVEAAANLVRLANVVAKSPQRPNSFAAVRANLNDRTLGDERAGVRAVKDRVLMTLRTLAQDGRLVASDFGSFSSGDIKSLLREIKPTRNACADEGLGG